MSSAYNPLEEFAIDLARKFKQLKTFNDEGNDGFRFIGVANQCNLDAKMIMRQIQQYVKAFERSESTESGELALRGKTITLPTGIEVTSVNATYDGEVFGYLVITITSVAEMFDGLDLPYALDIRVSTM